MTNSLFNVFHKFATSLELWNAIQRRYVNEDAGNKSFLINKYVEFKMDDSKPIIEQVNTLNDIATECADAGEPFSESFQVSTIIGKLPSSWKDYQRILKHKKKPLNLDELLQHIQIESEARLRDSLDNQGKTEILHNVEGPVSNSNKQVIKSQNGKKNSYHNKNSYNNKKRKFGNFNKKENTNKKKKGPCFVCGKLGHWVK